MSISAILPTLRSPLRSSQARIEARTGGIKRSGPPPSVFHGSAHAQAAEPPSGQAELFYLQKQIHAQTPMVIILEDGEQIEGCIEWYDRNSMKVRGRQKTLIYKSAIKYMYKLGDSGR